MNGLCHFCNTGVETLWNILLTTVVMQQNLVEIISALKNCMNSWGKQNVDINGITEEYIFLRIYEENSKESSVLNAIINMSKFSFESRVIVSGISKKCMHHKTLIQLMKSEIIKLIKNIPRKSIETRIFCQWTEWSRWIN